MQRTSQETVHLGFSRRKITPPLPIEMSGYYPMRIAESVHDHLYVRTHVFLNREIGEMVVFSSFDLVAIDVKLKESVLETLEHKYPEFMIHVFVSATHTHSAPAGTLDTRKGVKQSFVEVFGAFDEAYFTYCVEQCQLSIEEAITKAESFHYRLLIDEVTNVGKDRHDVTNEGDPTLVVMEFTLTNQAKSLLYIYSCHPTILSQKNKQISADLPWGVSRLLEEEYPVVQFINGNSGDISTRFTRETADLIQVQLFGEILADKIRRVQDQSLQTLETVNVWTEHASLKIKDKEGAYLDVLKTQFLKNIRELHFDYSLIRFGPMLFLTIPGEITSDLAMLLKEHFPHLYILGYTNDYLFYFASESMYEADEYEALSSFLEKGEMEKLMKHISKQIEGIL